MAVLVSIVGALAAVVGLMGLANPKVIVNLVKYCEGPMRFRLAVGVRLVMGVVFLIAAPACRLPVVVQVLGVIAIVAAFVLLIVGQKRLDTFITWWLSRPPAVVRVAALFALAFGALLIYAGA